MTFRFVGRWIVQLAAVAGLAAGLAGPATAQEASAPPMTAEPVAKTAPVVVDGRTLFPVRGVSAFPAKERARLIARSIKNAAKDQSVMPDDVQIAQVDKLWEMRAGKHPIMTVVEADARLEGVSDPKILAIVYRESVVQAIKAYRHERTAEALLLNGVYTVIATVVFLLALWATRWIFRRINQTLEVRYRERISRLEARTFRLLDAEQLWALLRGVVRAVKILALLALVYLYLNLVLALFPWTRPLANRLTEWLIDPLLTITRGVIAAIPDLIFVLIIIVITRYVLKMARLFFSAVSEERIQLHNFDPDWGWPTYRILRVLIIAFAVVICYPYIPGSDSAAFKGISIFLGVIVSLGSSSAIANMIAGYSMTYRRAFREGDRIKVDDLIGDVMEMRLLVTHLRSLKNEEIVVPNSLILSSNVINYSTLAADGGLILHTTVGIGYEVPWRQVEAMLMMAADRTPGLLREPKPFILHQALADYAVTYELNVYCDDPKRMIPLYTVLHRNILDVFNEYNVQIMTPSYEHDPDQPKVVPREQWYAAPAEQPDNEK